MSNILSQGATPPIVTKALWSWDLSSPSSPVVTGYPQASGFAATKTGLTSGDLQNFIGMPLQYFYTNPPTPIPSGVVTEWIRDAEDYVEQKTSILLCQTWVASPPAFDPLFAAQIGLIVNNSSGIQELGLDYDLADEAYDFMFPRAQDEGWMMQTTRYRPLQSMTYTASDPTAMKAISFVYPLLNQFFRVARSWFVEDKNFGMIRLVPAANVQMLPLFAMQLAFMGFAESVPGALWYQYTAGLTPNDYKSRFSFMRQLVLSIAAMIALTSMQSGVNYGAESVDTMVDGLKQAMKWGKGGAFGEIILQFSKRRDELMKVAIDMISGPMVTML